MTARPDSTLIRQYLTIIYDDERRLREISDDREKARSRVSQAIISYVSSETMETLRRIDVEELARGKHGLKVQALKNAGIDNLAELASKSVSSLKKLPGMGEQSACAALNAARDIENGVRELCRIRLKADFSDEKSVELICALHFFRESRSIIRRVIELYNSKHRDILALEQNLSCCDNPLSWLLAPQTEKQKALDAFELARELAWGSYNRQAGELCTAYSRLQRVTRNEGLADFIRHSAEYYTLLESFRPNSAATGDEDSGLSQDIIQAVDSQSLNLEGMKTELRRYQQFGSKYALNRKFVLLGDEMGLGKTVQAIAAMVSLRNEGATHFLVVCPAGVLINWCREIERHSDLKAVQIHRNYNAELAKWVVDGGVGVTTYEISAKLFPPDSVPLAMLVADEAHYIKNPETQRTKALIRLSSRAQRLLFMTGTPLENRVEEMCFLISMLQPELASALEKRSYMASSAAFRQLASPVYLRRTRENVLKELPDLIETQDWCELDRQEIYAYMRAAASENLMAMRQVSWDTEDPRDSAKGRRMLDICAEAEEDGSRVIVFSYFLNTLSQVQKLLGERCFGPITGAVSSAKRQEIIDEFSQSKPGSVLAAQIQAGGTGLNIQAANVVILCEPQLKPSIESQAISRAYRMGQLKNVLVHRLLAAQTIDERIMDILYSKSREFSTFAENSVSGERSLELTENESSQEPEITLQSGKTLVLEEKKRLGIE